jgi:hypothetical protein
MVDQSSFYHTTAKDYILPITTEINRRSPIASSFSADPFRDLSFRGANWNSFGLNPAPVRPKSESIIDKIQISSDFVTSPTISPTDYEFDQKMEDQVEAFSRQNSSDANSFL